MVGNFGLDPNNSSTYEAPGAFDGMISFTP